MEVSLDKIDKQFINKEIRQVVVAYIAVLFVLLIVYYVGFVFIGGLTKSYFENWLLLRVYTIVVFGVFGFFFIKHVRPPFKDLKAKVKIVKTGRVQDKSDNTNFGWTGNVGADLSSQPKLVEHFITVDNVRYFVTEVDFKKVEVGDNADLHFTSWSTKLIRIEKSLQ